MKMIVETNFINERFCPQLVTEKYKNGVLVVRYG